MSDIMNVPEHIERTLGRIEANISSLADDIKALVSDRRAGDKRVEALEKTVGRIIWTGTGVGLCIGFFMTIITKLIK